MEFFAKGGFHKLIDYLVHLNDDPDINKEFDINVDDSNSQQVNYQENKATSISNFDFRPDKDDVEFNGGMPGIVSGTGSDLQLDFMILDSNVNNHSNDDRMHDDKTFMSSALPNMGNELCANKLPSLNDWELRFLDDYVELPEHEGLLPEKTPLCTNTCDLFLQEGSKILKFRNTTDEATTSIVLPKTTDMAPTGVTAALSVSSRQSSPLEKKKTGYPCTFANCQKIYSRLGNLKTHLKRHLCEKPYICKWPGCSWKFARADEITRHERSHLGLRPYKCSFCGKCFTRSDHLNRHCKIHQ